jgi:hypothetical protein
MVDDKAGLAALPQILQQANDGCLSGGIHGSEGFVHQVEIRVLDERTGEDWSRHEVELIVSDYLGMLMSELAGQPYNKAAHRRQLQTQLKLQAPLIASWPLLFIAHH